MGWISACPQGAVWAARSLTCTFGRVQGVETLTGQQWPNAIAMRSALTRVRAAPVGRAAPDRASTAQLQQRARDADPRWTTS